MLKVYNTLKRDKVPFLPLQPDAVGIYACGVTVYDYCHIGHARTYAAVDTMVRYLRWRGYTVNYVRNITDIDDKIIKRANESNESVQVITERFIKAMNEDFDALGFLRPDQEPRAMDFMPEMIALIEKMLANKNAYIASNGDVYFNVRSFPQYGCLSNHNIEQLESGARVEVNEVKQDPLDFVLWKLAKPGEPSWDSPWGQGRPGWHTECSAMSMKLLGENFDMHMGGRDLIFPHHENEIAQSVSVSNKPFANVWLHMGFLNIDKEKMSKSLGNFVTIRDVLRDHSPEVVRYFLTAAHYRSPLIYTEDTLIKAKHSLMRFYTALRFLPTEERLHNSTYELSFIEAMNDDFNTPIALSVLFELAHEIQRLRDVDLVAAAKHGALLKYLGGTMGLLQSDPELFFKAGSEVDSAKVESLIAARQQARASKNWAEADRIRGELEAMAVVIEDGASGTTWKKL